MALFQIVIEGLKLYGYHGVHDDERCDGQQFEFDIVCDVERTSIRDDLQTTVDYVGVMNVIKAVNSAENFRLIETLGERIIERLFEKYSTISHIEICVRKHLRLTGVDVDRVAVAVQRARTE